MPLGSGPAFCSNIVDGEREASVIEAVMFWNEPNNKSHWDFVELDPQWRIFSDMVRLAAEAVAGESPHLTRVLGGISAVTALPIWVSEVGVSTFGADEVQEFGLERTAQLLRGRTERIHWYSLYDLPRAWPATTRHRESEGSAYYRHFYMGLLREDGSPKPAAHRFAAHTPELGICQWFHFQDHRLDDAVRWLRRLGVRHLRTGLSWADSLRPGALEWFDRQMAALEEFAVTVTFCFTPESRGIMPHHTSPPREIAEFADFCARMTRRYVPRAGARRMKVAGES
jgi:beta-xylosidase